MRHDPSFVLVHGAWQTAATWDLVGPRLREGGGRVFNALLTGLETDVNALTETVTLNTHIRDVAALVRSEALDNIVLVAVSRAADRPRLSGGDAGCSQRTVAEGSDAGGRSA